MEPEFKIPCELSIKKKINQAYDWSHEQLFDIVVNGGFVNLTTVWSSRTNEEYIGVTATWISSNFVLKEALLTIQPLPSPHTAENIKNALEKVITEWG